MINRKIDKNRATFWVLIITYLLLSIGDNVLTYIGTPDLAMEQNPIVSVFGLGWVALIVTDVMFYAIYVICAYYVFVRYKRPVIQCEGFRQFISLACYGRPDKYSWFWYKFPKTKEGWRFYLFIAGYPLVIGATVIRMMAVIDWIAILNGSPIYFLRNIVTPHSQLVVTCCKIILFSFCFGIIKEYRVNKKELVKLGVQ